MKTYQINLKGTKARNTSNTSVEIKANNKSQAFSIAYYFFEKGEQHAFMPEFFDVNAAQELKGKFKVGQKSVVCL